MKTPPVPGKISSLPVRRQLLNWKASVSRQRASSLLRGTVALAGSSLLAVGPLRAANTENDVASEPTTTQTAVPNLETATTYTSGVAPGTTSDLTFNATNNYSQPGVSGNTPTTGLFLLSPTTSGIVFSIGSLNDLSTSQVITIENGNGSTQAPFRLNGGDSVSGNPLDLLYVATGATLNLLTVNPTGTGNGTINLILGNYGNFDIAGTATISVPIESGTFSAGTTNPYGFTLTGGGTLTLSGANNFSGATTVNSGTLNLAYSSSNGDTRGIVTVNAGGTLNLTASNALGYTSGAQLPLINVNGGTVNTATAVGNEGYLTGFTLTGGTVNYAGSGTGTNIQNAYQFNAGTNGAVNLYTAAAITSNASANLSTFAGAINIRSGTLGVQVAQGTTTGGVDLLMSGIISNANNTSGLTKYGPGVLALSAASTYTGPTTVNAGTLSLTGSLASTTLALGGGTFAYAPTTAGSTQSFTGTTINAGGSTVTATNGNTVSLGAITHAAGGVVGFGGAGTITTTSAGANGILGPYAYTGTGAGLSYVTGAATAGTASTIAAYTGGTTTTDATGVTDTTGTVNYNVPAGGTVNGGAGGASANTLSYTGAGDTITGPITLNGLMNAGTGALTVNGNVTAGSTNELVVLSNGQNITLNGVVGNNGTTASALTYGGPTAGTLTLTGTNTYTGGTTFAGGIVNVGSAGALGAMGTLTFAGGTLQYSAANTTDYSGRLSTTVDQVYNIDTNGQTVTYATAFGSNGSILNKSGAGTLILSANNTYNGGTTVNAGTLKVTFGGQTYGALRGTVTVNTGGTLALNATDALGYSAISSNNSVANLNINGGTVDIKVAGNQGLTANLTMTGGTFSSTGGGSFNIDPGQANAPTITSNASATTSLISANVVNRAATASLPFNVASGAAGQATNGSDLTVSGIISGSGITKNGAGILTLTGANTYTGATTVGTGTLIVNGNQSGAAGAVSVASGSTLGGTGTIGGGTTVASGGTITGATNGTAGTLNLTTGLTINGTYVADVIAGAGTGTGSDKLAVSGAVLTLNNTSSVLSLAVQGTLSAAQYVLATYSTLSGTFNSITGTPAGYRVDYGPATNGAITLDAVPEPSTWLGGLLLTGIFGFALRRRMNTRVA